jgi:hypothetical protein
VEQALNQEERLFDPPEIDDATATAIGEVSKPERIE